MTIDHGSGTILEFRLGRKELTFGGNKREEEGEGGRRRGRVSGGSFLAPLQGQVLLSGSSGGLPPCQIYAPAEPHSVLAPARNGEKAGAQMGRMGQEVLPM